MYTHQRKAEIDQILKTIRGLLKKKDASAAVSTWFKETRKRRTSTSAGTLPGAIHAAKAITQASRDDLEAASATGSGLAMPGATEPAPGRPKKSGDFNQLSPHQQAKIRKIAEAQAQEADVDALTGYALSLADGSIYAVEDDFGRVVFVYFDPMTGDPMDASHLVQRAYRSSPSTHQKSILGIKVTRRLQY